MHGARAAVSNHVSGGGGLPSGDPVSVEVAEEWRGRRALDVAGALVLLVLNLPVLVAVALAVGLTSRGPVLFRQERVGRDGQRFQILKFRTMHRDAEERLQRDPELRQQYLRNGHKLPCRTDPRATAVGRVLRQLSLDELPQLINVVLGHMSLVGPRPVVPDELANYGELASTYLAVRPGMTGAWQVAGRNEIPFPARAELDAEYVRTRSPRRDLAILIRTPLVVLSRLGAQ